MTDAPTKTIAFTIHEGDQLAAEMGATPLADGLFHAATHLAGPERLSLIERLQKAHAELEARFR